MTPSRLQHILCSTLWVPRKFSFHHFCSTSAPYTFYQLPSSAHATGSCLAATCCLPSPLGSPPPKKNKVISLLPHHSLFRGTKKWKEVLSITDIHSGTSAVLCSSHKKSVQAREFHDGNWENHTGTYITVCICCCFVCSMWESEGVTFQWTNGVSK